MVWLTKRMSRSMPTFMLSIRWKSQRLLTLSSTPCRPSRMNSPSIVISRCCPQWLPMLRCWQRPETPMTVRRRSLVPVDWSVLPISSSVCRLRLPLNSRLWSAKGLIPFGKPSRMGLTSQSCGRRCLKTSGLLLVVGNCHGWVPIRPSQSLRRLLTPSSLERWAVLSWDLMAIISFWWRNGSSWSLSRSWRIRSYSLSNSRASAMPLLVRRSVRWWPIPMELLPNRNIWVAGQTP